MGVTHWLGLIMLQPNFFSGAQTMARTPPHFGLVDKVSHGRLRSGPTFLVLYCTFSMRRFLVLACLQVYMDVQKKDCVHSIE